LIASLPDYWQAFFHEAAAKEDYKPADPSVFRQNTVDHKAQLLTKFEPPSNDMAQTAGVAGVALYHVIVSRDGKPTEIVVGRPIGFGLDENAVDSIRKASFSPAMKDGQPVPVLVDLLVQFRIYSNRTSASASEASTAKVSETESPTLPGPYTANQPATKPQ
jgi:TonB family protein